MGTGYTGRLSSASSPQRVGSRKPTGPRLCATYPAHPKGGISSECAVGVHRMSVTSHLCCMKTTGCLFRAPTNRRDPTSGFCNPRREEYHKSFLAGSLCLTCPLGPYCCRVSWALTTQSSWHSKAVQELQGRIVQGGWISLITSQLGATAGVSMMTNSQATWL